jgi:hypothetical protein
MGSIRYGKLKISEDQQSWLLHDLPAPMSQDCYFHFSVVSALLKRAGVFTVCKHCGKSSRASISQRAAKALAKLLLRHWQDQHICTYSAVLDKYRRLP